MATPCFDLACAAARLYADALRGAAEDPCAWAARVERFREAADTCMEAAVAEMAGGTYDLEDLARIINNSDCLKADIAAARACAEEIAWRLMIDLEREGKLKMGQSGPMLADEEGRWDYFDVSLRDLRRWERERQ